MPTHLQSKVCSTHFSSKANWESPVKLLELFPNANMCYRINKATKDANREIRAAHLASVGRKRNETFPSRLRSVFSLLRARHICMFLFEDLLLKDFTRSRGPASSVGIHNAFSF